MAERYDETIARWRDEALVAAKRLRDKGDERAYSIQRMRAEMCKDMLPALKGGYLQGRDSFPTLLERYRALEEAARARGDFDAEDRLKVQRALTEAAYAVLREET